jgi:NAD(P)-dependent dehydrogenase (short-subunit alcohol dehydrogenase family)
MQSELRNQTVVVIGGTSGIGLETARRARAEGAQVILTARHPERLEEVAREVEALKSAAFDANDFASLQSFFLAVPTEVNHVLVTAGAPHYGSLLDMPLEEIEDGLSAHLLLALKVARCARQNCTQRAP